MPAYVIFTEAISDPAAMESYVAKAGPTVAAHGGTLRIASGAVDVIEGEWHGNHTVMLEFESVDAATAWYQSEEYQAVAPERFAAAVTNAAIFEQFEMPGAS